MPSDSGPTDLPVGTFLLLRDLIQDRIGTWFEDDKRDPADFALWKAAGEGRLLRWPSRWGDGFPGWHLECSAMAMRHLGPRFEIHTGGIDNVFPHHEDEIAQSGPVVGDVPARHWVHGEHLLMGRQAAWPARRHSVIAGFVEPGETLEQAVSREVMEETGIRVTRCRYLGSQPWPMPTSLMLGFIAEAEPGDVVCTDELEEARWFTRAEIVEALAAEARGEIDASPFLLPSSISIAHWLVREWVRETA